MKIHQFKLYHINNITKLMDFMHIMVYLS